MQNRLKQLQPAQEEVQRTARNQDMVEVPKRAVLDRENEYRKTYEEVQAGVKQYLLTSK